jgi:hypothetical protein
MIQGHCISVPRALDPRFGAPRGLLELRTKSTRIPTCCRAKKREQEETPQQENISAANDSEAAVPLRATQPVVLPILMLANLAVYGTGIAIALLMDGETSNQFFFAFANMKDEVQYILC